MRITARLFLLMVLLIISAAVFAADVKMIVAEGTYNMGDGETPTIAEERALLQAKRIALEQAGTYVESYSKVRNYQLTSDEVEVISSGIMEVTILEKRRTLSGDTINFWVKIKALVHPERIEDMVSRLKDKTVVADYKQLQEKYDESQQEIATLKEQLANSSTSKERIKTSIAANEASWSSIQLMEMGDRAVDAHSYPQAISHYSSAIAVDRGNGLLFMKRGFAYSLDRQHEVALQDFDVALSLNPGLSRAHYGKGTVFEKLNRPADALSEYQTYVAQAPNDGYVSLAQQRIQILKKQQGQGEDKMAEAFLKLFINLLESETKR